MSGMEILLKIRDKIQEITSQIEELEDDLRVLKRTEELLSEPSQKKVRQEVKKRRGPKPGTGVKGVSAYVTASDETVYRVTVWDKYAKKTRSKGAHKTIKGAIEARDALIREIEEDNEPKKRQSNKPEVDVNDSLCKFGWECKNCGKKYDQRVIPVMCTVCESNEFVKQEP